MEQRQILIEDVQAKCLRIEELLRKETMTKILVTTSAVLTAIGTVLAMQSKEPLYIPLPGIVISISVWHVRRKIEKFNRSSLLALLQEIPEAEQTIGILETRNILSEFPAIKDSLDLLEIEQFATMQATRDFS